MRSQQVKLGLRCGIYYSTFLPLEKLDIASETFRTFKESRNLWVEIPLELLVRTFLRMRPPDPVAAAVAAVPAPVAAIGSGAMMRPRYF